MIPREDTVAIPASGVTHAGVEQCAAELSPDWLSIWTLILSVAAIGAAAGKLAAPSATTGMFLPALAMTVCFLAAWYDAASSRIPNQLTYTAIMLGLALNCAKPVLGLLGAHVAERWLDAVGPGQAFLGFAVCAGIGLFSLLLAGMGGGDMKLLAALGAMMGMTRVTPILICALAAAVAYAFLNLVFRGKLNAVARSAALTLLELATLHRPDRPPASSQTTIPLAIPLLIGLVLARVLPSSWLAAWTGAAG